MFPSLKMQASPLFNRQSLLPKAFFMIIPSLISYSLKKTFLNYIIFNQKQTNKINKCIVLDFFLPAYNRCLTVLHDSQQQFNLFFRIGKITVPAIMPFSRLFLYYYCTIVVLTYCSRRQLIKYFFVIFLILRQFICFVFFFLPGDSFYSLLFYVHY